MDNIFTIQVLNSSIVKDINSISKYGYQLT